MGVSIMYPSTGETEYEIENPAYKPGEQYTPSMLYVTAAAVIRNVMYTPTNKQTLQSAYWIVLDTEQNYTKTQVKASKQREYSGANDFYHDLGIIFTNENGEKCLMVRPMLDSNAVNKRGEMKPDEFIQRYQKFIEQHPNDKPSRIFIPLEQEASGKHHYILLEANIDQNKQTVQFNSFDSLSKWSANANYYHYLCHGNNRIQQLANQLQPIFLESRPQKHDTKVTQQWLGVQGMFDSSNCGPYVISIMAERIRGNNDLKKLIQQLTQTFMNTVIRPLHSKLAGLCVKMTTPAPDPSKVPRFRPGNDF